MNLEYISQNWQLFAALALWELVWKGLALWKSAQKNQLNWFIALLFINTLGILPIIYLLLNNAKRANRS